MIWAEERSAEFHHLSSRGAHMGGTSTNHLRVRRPHGSLAVLSLLVGEIQAVGSVEASRARVNIHYINGCSRPW